MTAVEHVDVLIVGAGLSGIGAAHHVTSAFPERRVVVLESRADLGGTWDLFRYPGIRSDSDMSTMGYRHHPWTGTSTLASGPAIKDYLAQTARESGVDRLIRFRHRVVAADWSTADARWSVRVEEETADGPWTFVITTDFLIGCTGYYRYDEGYTPYFEGREDFRGRIVHPQHWPEDLDCAGRRVVVIGSGATAVTLVPALAETAAHVTMLQRSPSYIASLPSTDPFLESRVASLLPLRVRHRLVRGRNIVLQGVVYRASRRWPGVVRRILRAATRRQVPDDVDVDVHFNPSYDPWDQRLCMVPDGDLFRALRRGVASIVTGHIERFDETGIRLRSGEHLDADVIVTATGLNLQAFGGIELRLDGEPVHLPDTLAYRGLMLSGVPNFVYVIGYTNASWTLKADLVSEFVVRLLQHLDRTGQRVVRPVRPDDVEEAPFLDLASGYIQRAAADLPKQGTREPWRLRQNYFRDARSLRRDPLEDGALAFHP